MTRSEFAEFVRLQTGKSAATLPNATLALYTNVYVRLMADKIADLGESEFQVRSYTDLIAGQREYTYPEDTINVNRLEVKFDGEHFIPVNRSELDQYGNSTAESIIVANFGNYAGGASFKPFGGSFYIFSGTIEDTVEDGIEVWRQKYPSKFTAENMGQNVDLSVPATATDVGFPAAFHELLARQVVIAVKNAGDKPVALTANELKLDVDIENAIYNYRGNTKGGPFNIQVEAVPNAWDNGYNL